MSAMITIQEPVRLVNLQWELSSENGLCGTENNTESRSSRNNNCRTIDISGAKRCKKTSNFPLSTDLALLDSKKSIRSGVKYSLLWFHAQNSYIEPQLELEVIRNGNDSEGDVDEYEEVDVHPLLFKKRVLHSCLKKGTNRVAAIGDKNKLLGLVQRRIQRIVEERFPLHVVNSFKVCIVNTVLQNYETDDLSAIYNKLFRKDGKERIIQIVEQSYFDKYPLEQLDNFYDELFGCIGQCTEYNIFASNKPSFYKLYTDIWKLDREGFKDYNYQCFVEYCEEQQQQQYDYDDEDFTQEWLHEYANQGILMNVEKFYYYFHRKVEPFKDSEEKVMKINESRRNSYNAELNRRNSRSNSNGSSKPNINQVEIMKLSLVNILSSKMMKIEESNREAIEGADENNDSAVEDLDYEEDDEQSEEETRGRTWARKKNRTRRKLVRFDEERATLDFDPREPSCRVLYDATNDK